MKPVHMMYRIALTNTLNYNVRGEIRKITLLNSGMHIVNRLAPEHRRLFMIILQAGAFVPVQAKRSEYSNPTIGLLFDKTCQVSPDILLLIK